MHQLMITELEKARSETVSDFGDAAKPAGWIQTRDVWWPAFAVEPTGYLLCCARAAARETNRGTLDVIGNDAASTTAGTDVKHNGGNGGNVRSTTRQLPAEVLNAFRVILAWLRNSSTPFVPYRISEMDALAATVSAASSSSAAAAAAASATLSGADDQRQTSITRIVSFIESFVPKSATTPDNDE